MVVFFFVVLVFGEYVELWSGGAVEMFLSYWFVSREVEDRDVLCCAARAEIFIPPPC